VRPLGAIATGGNPYAVAVTPDGRTLYVTDGAASGSTVTPVDLTTGSPGPPIAVGSTPRGIAITPDQAPVARLGVTPGAPGAATRFDASASTVAFGAIASYAWDFGDGTPVVRTATPAVSHSYARAGLFTATVTEADGIGTSTPPADPTFTGQTATASPSGHAQAGATFAVGHSAVTPPVAGRTVVAQATAGTVLVRRKGSSRFRALRSLSDLPTGSELDTAHGSVRLTVARDASHATDTAALSGGRFVVTQTRGAAPVATFALSAPLNGCSAARGGAAPTARAARRRKRTRTRHITVKETTGRFATKGQYVAASVQGTTWTTKDGCGTSTVGVAQGLVRVRDLVLRKSVTVGAGERYTARKP
jgi:DNA-binding beta-propeller fold protein YncE